MKEEKYKDGLVLCYQSFMRPVYSHCILQKVFCLEQDVLEGFGESKELEALLSRKSWKKFRFLLLWSYLFVL